MNLLIKGMNVIENFIKIKTSYLFNLFLYFFKSIITEVCVAQYTNVSYINNYCHFSFIHTKIFFYSYKLSLSDKYNNYQLKGYIYRREYYEFLIIYYMVEVLNYDY